MNKSAIMSVLSIVFLASNANAATFNLTFYTDYDGSSGHNGVLRNINTAPILGTGVLEVDDNAIAPNAFVKFGTDEILQFSASYVDQYGVALSYDLFTDPSSFEKRNFGVLFDEEGKFDRFDTPDYSLLYPGAAIYDDELDLSGTTLPGPSLSIVDDDNLGLAYLVNDVFRFNRQFKAGDLVAKSNFMDQEQIDIANAFTAKSSKKEVGGSFATGLIVASVFEDQTGDPTTPVSSVAAVPLPASLPMLLVGFAGLGWMRKRQRN